MAGRRLGVGGGRSGGHAAPLGGAASRTPTRRARSPRVPGADADAGYHVRGRAGSLALGDPAHRPDALRPDRRGICCSSPWPRSACRPSALDLVERRRVAQPRPRLTPARQSERIGLRHLCAGAAAAGVLTMYEIGLRRIVTNTSLDVLHFSLHPLEAQRLAIAFGLVLLHAAAIWDGCCDDPCCVDVRPRAAIAGGAIVGGLRLDSSAPRWSSAIPAAAWNVPIVPLATAVGVAGGCAAMIGSVERRLRRASQAARLFTFFLALLVPALAMYPSLVAYAIDAKQGLVADIYGPEVLSQREDLQRRLQQTIDQIDAIPSLSDYLGGAEGAAAADRAFVIWSRTDLASYRLTSAVELYGADGALVSRFALHLPEYEYSPARSRTVSCTWETLFDEVSAVRFERTPRAQDEPRHLRARPRARQRRRPRDARLSDAAVHLHAESVSPIARTRAATERPRASRAATSSSRCTAGAGRQSSNRGRPSGRCRTGCSGASSPRANRSGTRSSATTRVSTCIS